jgi:hypothetical protein
MICATWPEAINALTVTRLRSRGARSGHNQRSRNRTSVVYCTIPGATLPNCCSTPAARRRLSGKQSDGWQKKPPSTDEFQLPRRLYTLEALKALGGQVTPVLARMNICVPYALQSQLID